MSDYPLRLVVTDATGFLDRDDLAARLEVAQGYRSSVYRYFSIHESGCGSEKRQACNCGLVVAFSSPRSMVVVDPLHRVVVHCLH